MAVSLHPFVALLWGCGFGRATVALLESDWPLEVDDAAVSLLQLHSERSSAAVPRQEQGQSPGVQPIASRRPPWNVQITGRYKLGDDSRAILFDEAGVKLSARFSGVETLSATMRMTCHQPCAQPGFVVWCDGELTAGPGVNAFRLGGKDARSERVIPVCSGLDPQAEHTVLVLKNSGTCCPVEFKGFGEAALLDPPLPPSRRVEYIGDSVTNGAFAMCDEDSYALGFAERSCEMLGADCHATSLTGIGLNRNVDINRRLFKDLWEDTLWSDADAGRWDFGSWIPDAVVVNLGTIDNVGDSQENADAYKVAYLAWLARANEVYKSKPTFFLACGPMKADYCAIVEEVIDEASRQGVKASFIDMMGTELPHSRQHDLHTCLLHPNVDGHAFLAEQVAKAVRSELGWD